MKHQAVCASVAAWATTPSLTYNPTLNMSALTCGEIHFASAKPGAAHSDPLARVDYPSDPNLRLGGRQCHL